MNIFLRSTAITLLSAISIHAVAASGVTVISSKTEMSPGFHGGFITRDATLTANHYRTIGNAHAYAKANSAYGHKNENIRITGDHAYIIENRSGKPQYYDVEYRLMLADGRFIRRQDTVRIDNNSIAKANTSSYMTQLFPIAGNYHFAVETNIKGEYVDYAREGGDVTVNG